MKELTAEEVRVLGCLLEKEATTPQYYPLTLNALVAACNQSSNRDPLVDYDGRTVEDALTSLREGQLIRLVYPSHGGRSTKYRHVLGEALGLEREALALLCVLMLRGPQTTGELRTRTDRMASFDGLGDVERTLDTLASREEALVVRLERQPGQKEARYAHLLCGQPVLPVATFQGVPASASPSSSARAGLAEEVAGLREEVAALRREVAELRSLLD